MAQQTRLGKGNTAVFGDNGYTVVRYHQTEILRFNAETIELKTGGWFTASTKTRLNQASNQFHLGFSVHQKDGSWYVRYKREKVTFLADILILER